MFSKFSKPSHSFAISSKPGETNDQPTNYILSRRNVLYTSLLSGGLLLSGAGYNFIKELIHQTSVVKTEAQETAENKKDQHAISVVAYVNFDNRGRLEENTSKKAVLIETPHLEKYTKREEGGEGGNIKGYITDEQGQPLNSADVLLYRDNKLIAVAYTMGNGEFNFPNVEPDFYKLKVLRAGYKELDYPEFEIAPNTTTFMDIDMETLNFATNLKKEKRGTGLSNEGLVYNEPTRGDNLAVTIIIRNPVEK